MQAVIGCFWVGYLSEDDFKFRPFSGFGCLVIIFGLFYLLLHEFYVASSVFYEVNDLVPSWGEPLPAVDSYGFGESPVYVLCFEVISYPLCSGIRGSLFVPLVELCVFAHVFLRSLLFHVVYPCCPKVCRYAY